MFRLIVPSMLALLWSPAAEEESGPPSRADLQIEELVVEPSPLLFQHLGEGRKVLVTGIAASQERLDLTAVAEWSIQDAIVERREDGFLYARGPGETQIQVRAGNRRATLPVTIRPSGTRGVTFVRDVLPILNRVGCTQGTCHGAAKGKNGFKLSLRGYDPEFDYQALLYDMSGRRFNRADPARSLMLAKPTQQVAHQGGLRIEAGSRYYDVLLEWISAGVPFGDLSQDTVQELKVLPQEIFMHAPGRKQEVVVLARYGDESWRDVTREAHVSSSNTEALAVVEGPAVEGIRKGEGALLVRYEGKFVTVPATVLNPDPGFQWAELPRYNYIDELIDAKLHRLKIQPSPPAGDAEFLRRVYLDLTGKLPAPETVRAFLADPTEARVKRSRLVDQLMGSEDFVSYWTLKWGDLLKSNRKFMGYKGVWAFREWLRQAVAENKPYDQFVRELLTAKGSTFEVPTANFFRAAADAKEAMETTTQLFMGVRMVCAQCHDHPFEQWTQNQYYEMAAFFAPVGVRPGFKSGEEIVFLKRFDNQIKHPKYGTAVAPRLLLASHAPSFPLAEDPRETLAQWLTADDNPFFAPAIANRIWSYFFGRGIIEPVDDIRASNPAVNPPLLQALAEDLKKHDYDLQHLMRTIVNSRAYQSTFRTNPWNEDDDINFSHHLPRRLTAEQLADAVAAATGSSLEFSEVPKDFQARELPDPHVGMTEFLDLFGRPPRESPCECERRGELNLPQALNLVNGATLADAIADPEGRVARLILKGASDAEIVEELYLATLSRFPDAEEKRLAEDHFKSGESRASAAQDLLWALLNSNGFLFN